MLIDSPYAAYITKAEGCFGAQTRRRRSCLPGQSSAQFDCVPPVATNLDEEISFAALLFKVGETGLESVNPEGYRWNWILRIIVAGHVA